MRDNLAPLMGRKSIWYGTVKRFGWRKFMGAYVGKTLLLVDLKDKDGKVIADHLWMKVGKRLGKLELKPGDVIRFEARVDTYSKGGRDSDAYDYHLEYPDRLAKVDALTFVELGQATLT